MDGLIIDPHEITAEEYARLRGIPLEVAEEQLRRFRGDFEPDIIELEETPED